MLFDMSNPAKELTPFGRTIKALMDGYRLTSQAAFAKATKVPASSLSRWLTDPTVTPEPYMLDRVAERLSASAADRQRLYERLMVAAGHIPAPEAPDPTDDLPPEAREVGRLLGERSPLPKQEREMLAEMLSRLLSPYRATSTPKRPRR